MEEQLANWETVLELVIPLANRSSTEPAKREVYALSKLTPDRRGDEIGYEHLAGIP
jgi:hypothetical protein